MGPMRIFAQVIGIVAMLINVLSYQCKKQRPLIVMQLVSSTFYAVNLFILDAPTGCVLNLVGICRAIVFSNKKFFRADRKIWIAVFSLASAGVYALTFLVFGKEPTAKNLIIEFLPVIGMIATTVGFYRDGAKDVRLLSLINSPCWLVYHLTTRSIGGIAGEVVMLISIVVGYLRHDRKKPEETAQADEVNEAEAAAAERSVADVSVEDDSSSAEENSAGPDDGPESGRS